MLNFRTKLIAVLTLALLLRLGVSLAVSDHFLDVDGRDYQDIAFHLSEGDGFVIGYYRWFEPEKYVTPEPPLLHPDAYRPPLLPLLGAPLYWLPLPWEVSARAVVLLWSVALIGAATSTANHLAGKNAALFAAAIGAASPFGIWYSTVWSTEALSGCCLWWGMLGLLRFRRAERTERDGRGGKEVFDGRAARFAAGLLLGAACLARPNLLLVVGLLLVWVAWESRQRLRRFGLIVLGVGLVVTPWIARNAVVLDRPTPATSFAAYNFWLGMNDRIHTLYTEDLGPVEFQDNLDRLYAEDSRDRVRTLAAQGDLSIPTVSRYWFDEGLDYMQSHPKESAEILAHRLVHYFRLSPFRGAASGAERCVSIVFFGLLFVLAAIGVRFVRATREPILWLALLGSVAGSIPFVFHLRFRFPVAEPLLWVLSAVGAAYLIRRLDRRSDHAQQHSHRRQSDSE